MVCEFYAKEDLFNEEGFTPLEGPDPWRVQTLPVSKKKPLPYTEEAFVFTAAAA
jgi:hypothetical protein